MQMPYVGHAKFANHKSGGYLVDGGWPRSTFDLVVSRRRSVIAGPYMCY